MTTHRDAPSAGIDAAAPHPPPARDASPSRSKRWLWLLLLPALGWAAYRAVAKPPATPPSTAPGNAARPALPVPVVAVAARQGALPVYLNGLGTITAFNTVTVRSRVDGQLTNVAFQEGQFVHEGDLLAEIDPRPFQVQLAQAEGQMARDAAQLKEGKLNLQRYRELLTKNFVPRQQADDQAATVAQLEGAIKMDQSAIDNAKLQLTYSRITAPISGRIGLRLVDVGNMVHATDQTGLLVITQVQPIAALFTIPEDNLPPVVSKLRAGEHLSVDAFDRAGQTKIAEGTLLTVDNQIDQNTGTTRLKAMFQNQDNSLYPNQFVNLRLLLDVKSEAIIVPAAAIQRGPQGTFVYVVKADQTVEMRPVKLGPTAGDDASIESGVSAKEQVVVDGIDKLRAGSAVQVHPPEGNDGGAGTPSA